MITVDAQTGLVIDDCTEYEDGEYSHWTQLCDNHAVHSSPTLQEMSTEGFICGVEGCNEEALYYYDFNPKQ